MRPKTPKRPSRPKTSQSEYIIPKPVSADSESALDDDATSFMAITPKVAKNPAPSPQNSSMPSPSGFGTPNFGGQASLPPGYGAPPPSPQVVTPPPVPAAPTIGVGGQGPSIAAGGQAPIIGSAHQPQFGGQVTPPNQDVVDDSELSGSLRVPVLLLSAVAFVCLAALAVVFLLPKPEPEKPAQVIKTVERVERYVEPDSPPVEIAELKPQKVTPTKQRVRKKAKATTATLSLTMGTSSDRVSSVNVTCGDFRKRASIRNKKVSIPNVPLGKQCKFKFSPGGGMHIEQTYTGAAMQCNVMNGNEAKCN